MAWLFVQQEDYYHYKNVLWTIFIKIEVGIFGRYNLLVEINIVHHQIGKTPGNCLVLPQNDDRHPWQCNTAHIESSAREMHLVPDRGLRKRQMGIIRQDWCSRCRTTSWDNEIIRAQVIGIHLNNLSARRNEEKHAKNLFMKKNLVPRKRNLLQAKDSVKIRYWKNKKKHSRQKQPTPTHFSHQYVCVVLIKRRWWRQQYNC